MRFRLPAVSCLVAVMLFASPAGADPVISHVVRPGDTLASIAERLSDAHLVSLAFGLAMVVGTLALNRFSKRFPGRITERRACIEIWNIGDITLVLFAIKDIYMVANRLRPITVGRRRERSRKIFLRR